MGTMGRYCKSYSLKNLREFGGWIEKAEQARKENRIVNGNSIEAPRPLADGDYVYLQENYVVTDGIFKDENILFDNVTPEWIGYCRQTLNFEIPVYESIQASTASNQGA